MKTKLFLLLSLLTVSQIVTSAFMPSLGLPVKLAKPEDHAVRSDQAPITIIKSMSLPLVNKIGQKVTDAKPVQDKTRKPKVLPSIAQVPDAVPKTKIENQPHDIFESKNVVFRQSRKFHDYKEPERLKDLKAKEEESWSSKPKYDQTPPTKLQKLKTYVAQHPYKTAAIIVVVAGIVASVIVAYKRGYLKNPFARATAQKNKETTSNSKNKKRKK